MSYPHAKVVVTLDGLKSRRPIVNLKTELGLDNADFHGTKSKRGDSHGQHGNYNRNVSTARAIVPVEQSNESNCAQPVESKEQSTWRIAKSAMGSVVHQKRAQRQSPCNRGSTSQVENKVSSHLLRVEAGERMGRGHYQHRRPTHPLILRTELVAIPGTLHHRPNRQILYQAMLAQLLAIS